MSDILLSFCIPTHDGRAAHLKEAIDSMLPQILGHYEGSVQICISDNGSKDGTAEMLKSYQTLHPGIFVVHRFEEDQGGLVNTVKSVQIAEGEYCWMFGSDDKLAPGAIDIVQDLLNRRPDISGALFSWRNFTDDFSREISDLTYTDAPKRPPEHIYDSADTMMVDLCLFLGNYSSQMFRRSLWLGIVEDEGVDNVFKYRHALCNYMPGRIAVIHPKWAWIGQRLVFHRDNNMFGPRYYNHNMTDYMVNVCDDGFRSWDALINKRSPAYRQVQRKLFKSWFPTYNIIQFKLWSNHKAKEDWELTACLYKHYGSLPEFYFIALPQLVLPHWLIKGSMSVTKVIAIRTRIRALLRICKIVNPWTVRYDQHTAEAQQRAAVQEQNINTGKDSILHSSE